MYILIGYIILGILSVLSIVDKGKHPKFFDACALFTVLLIVFSFPLGRDVKEYVEAFNRVSSFQDAFIYHTQRNFGFNALLYVTKLICPEYRFFRIVFNGIVMGLLSFVIFRYSKNRLLSVMLMLGSGVIVVFYASAIRQMMAMAIFIVAYYSFLSKKNYVIYYVLAILASSFHETAFVAFFIPVLAHCLPSLKEKWKKLFIIGLTVSILGFAFMKFFLPGIVYQIGFMDPLTHGLIYFTESDFSMPGLLLRIILFIINAGLFYYVDPEKRDNQDKLFFAVTTCSLFFYILLCNYSVISRIADFIAVIEIIALPNLIMKISSQNRKVIAICVLVCINFVLLYTDVKEKTDYNLGNVSYSLMEYPYIPIINNSEIETIITVH